MEKARSEAETSGVLSGGDLPAEELLADAITLGDIASF
jgi:hypothetical protein